MGGVLGSRMVSRGLGLSGTVDAAGTEFGEREMDVV